ncbi:hypothetical protein ACH9L7_01615 [Haloferax sp. S1W]|uniref:hypothetical protein n=1 Tax=Haloferax sp. S1W TaxID=3377110 RepID=UPI0037C87F8C
MSDETASASEAKQASTQSAPNPDVDPTDQTNEEFAARMRRYLDYAVLVGLLLLALIAALQFYLNASQTISTWVNPEYRAPFQAAFNLVLLLGAAFGITVQLRRLTRD